MILKDGKFYEGETLVPLEFGNKEQIRLMNEAKAHVLDLQDDGVEVDINVEEVKSYNASVFIKCLCGHNMFHEVTGLDGDDEMDDFTEEFDGDVKTCPKCKKKYEFSINEDDALVYKLVK